MSFCIFTHNHFFSSKASSIVAGTQRVVSDFVYQNSEIKDRNKLKEPTSL